MSMDNSGKIIWAKHSEIQQANLKILGGDSISLMHKLEICVVFLRYGNQRWREVTLGC